jgi:polyisoprenoid-binding protein YceI
VTHSRHGISSSSFLSAMLVVTSAAAREAAPIEAPVGPYTLEKEHASLTWRVRQMGSSNYTARFKRSDATTRFDPAEFGKSSVQSSIDLGSVETGLQRLQGVGGVVDIAIEAEILQQL